MGVCSDLLVAITELKAKPTKKDVEISSSVSRVRFMEVLMQIDSSHQFKKEIKVFNSFF
jgi:hypothetical protein